MFDNKRLFRLFLPVFIEQSLATFITMIGTMMVSGISPAAISGVSLVDSINFLVMNAFTAVATGVTVVVSQYIGAKDYTAAGKAAGQSIVISMEVAGIAGLIMIVFAGQILQLLFGGAEADVLSSARTFLIASSITLPFQALYATCSGITRAAGDSKSPMFASIVANVVYISVAWLMINLLQAGVLGAGIGLGVSRLVSSAIMLHRLLRGHFLLSIPKLSIRPDMAVLRPVLKIAVPAGTDATLFNFGKIIVQIFMSGMGTPALAAHSIISSLSGITNIPGNAISIISMTIVGQTYGAGKIRETMRSMKKLTVIGCMMLAIACAIAYLFIGPLVGLYSPTPESAAIATRTFAFVLACNPLIWVPSFTVPNMLRSTGDTTFTMLVSISSMFILRVVGAWFFGVYLNWGVFGIWFSMVIDWVGRAAFFLPRMLTGAWCKDYKKYVSGEALVDSPQPSS